MGVSGNGGVPDILLELYLAGDLSEAERRRIEAACDRSEAVRLRLAEIKAAREAFLATAPPAEFAHRLAVRLAHAGPLVRPSRLWALVAPVAAGLTAVVIFTRFGDEQALRQPPAEPFPPPATAPPATVAEAVKPEGYKSAAEERTRAREGDHRPEAPALPSRSTVKAKRGAYMLDADAEMSPQTSRQAQAKGSGRGAGAAMEEKGAGPVGLRAMSVEAPLAGPATGALAETRRDRPSPAPAGPGMPRPSAAAEPATAAAEAHTERASATGAEDPAPAPAEPRAVSGDARAHGKGKPEAVLNLRAVWAGCAARADHPAQSIEAQVCQIKTCVERAATAGEVEAGRPLRVTLKWRTRADGGVESPRWESPAGLRQSGLAGCVLTAMRGWRLVPRAFAVEERATWIIEP